MNLFKRNKDKDGSREPTPEDGAAEERKKSMSPSAMTASMKQYFKKSPKETKEPEPSPDNAKDVVESDTAQKSTMSDYAKQYFKQASSWTAKEASEASEKLKKAAGLGARPDVVPEGEALVSGEPRNVELGWVSTLRLIDHRACH